LTETEFELALALKYDELINTQAERDELLNQLDSARHSIEVLEKRVAQITKQRDASLTLNKFYETDRKHLHLELDNERQYQVSMEHLWAHDRELISTLRSRIEDLELELYDMNALYGQVKDGLEAKLAKAMKALRLYVSKEKGVLHTADVVLAEIDKQ
jgi:predicted  nucleic acid-binding Zn-ribbon protein